MTSVVFKDFSGQYLYGKLDGQVGKVLYVNLNGKPRDVHENDILFVGERDRARELWRQLRAHKAERDKEVSEIWQRYSQVEAQLVSSFKSQEGIDTSSQA